jgi:hypothetical protein
MSRQPGVVVIDANIVRYLGREAAVVAFTRNSAAANLRIWPSALNVVEVLKHPNLVVRERMLHHLEQWLGTFPLLPWPVAILEAAGRAALRGQSDFLFRDAGFDTLALDPSGLSADHEKARAFLEPLDRILTDAHHENDATIRRGLKAEGRVEELQDPRVFLDEVWADPENRDHQLALIWETIGLPEAPPSELLSLSEPWRIIFDALGASIFFRSVRVEAQGNPASLVDLFQLVYLSVSKRSRIFVSDDKALRETATAVFRGRYANVRIMSGGEFEAA